MSDLTKFTDEALRAELERRAVPVATAPAPAARPDWRALEQLVKNYQSWVESPDYNDDEAGDWRVLIYEAAIEAVFGPGFWAWKNGFRR